ncbi:hypothetical protein AAFF_G00137100 [Aldrovandia affinis]|uniref:Uncharacterized protein n=1 Tax=Aldrovandia affinis TaxID=143900 RepID=A0AAD7X1T7_9TELE|nr:hypothetical protein AAFF_G00137100 [Aldrovandia affinis]
MFAVNRWVHAVSRIPWLYNADRCSNILSGLLGSGSGLLRAACDNADTGDRKASRVSTARRFVRTFQTHGSALDTSIFL